MDGKVVKESKDIELNEFEKNSNDQIKKCKLVQNSNRLILNYEEEKKENEIIDKEKVIFKKSIQGETIIYEYLLYIESGIFDVIWKIFIKNY